MVPRANIKCVRVANKNIFSNFFQVLSTVCDKSVSVWLWSCARCALAYISRRLQLVCSVNCVICGLFVLFGPVPNELKLLSLKGGTTNQPLVVTSLSFSRRAASPANPSPTLTKSQRTVEHGLLPTMSRRCS